MKNKIYLIPFIGIAFVFQSCGEGSGQGEESFTRVTPSVEAVQAQYGSLPLEERMSGIVRPKNQVDIYPRINAPVDEVLAEDGDRVRRGDVLVVLRDTEYREQLRQAEANLRINKARERQALAALNETESQVRRQRVLDERELSSDLEREQLQAELESAEANYELTKAQVEQAESSVAEAREALDQTRIKAPISGTVGQRNAQIGMQATNSTRLFTIGDLEETKVMINLTERMLGYVTTGQSVNIYSENLGDTVLTGEVSRISPFLSQGSFSTEAEIDIDNTSRLLLPGMFVTVDILYGESEQATLIPMSAIYRHPRTGETGVFVAPEFGLETEPVEQVDSDNPPPLSQPTVVEFIPIEVVAQGREMAGVAGIQNGQWVITVGQNLLSDGEENARIRATSWSRIMGMQQLRPQDLLRDIMNEKMVDGAMNNNPTQS